MGWASSCLQSVIWPERGEAKRNNTYHKKDVKIAGIVVFSFVCIKGNLIWIDLHYITNKHYLEYCWESSLTTNHVAPQKIPLASLPQCCIITTEWLHMAKTAITTRHYGLSRNEEDLWKYVWAHFLSSLTFFKRKKKPNTPMVVTFKTHCISYT